MDLTELKSTNENFIRHPWEESRMHVISGLLIKCIRREEDDVKILDIGCGDAYVATSLSKDFKQCSFIAYDKYFTDSTLELIIDRSKELENLEIKKSIDENQSDISVVLLLDVIEHIEDDLAFLTDLRKQSYINNNTNLLITVPAFNNLFSDHDLFLGHFRRYNKRSLERVISKAGYEIVEMDFFFFTPLLGRYLKMSQEKRNTKKRGIQPSGVAKWQHNLLITKMIKYLLIIDYEASKLLAKVGIRLPGLSMSCICRPTV